MGSLSFFAELRRRNVIRMAVVTHKPCVSPVDDTMASEVLRRYAEDIRSDIAEIDELNRISTQRMSALNHLLLGATGGSLRHDAKKLAAIIASERRT